MGRTKNKEISAALFKKVAPLLPIVAASAKGGRPRVSDEQALNGILFVLRTGIPWEELPQELGFGSGMTCWRRLPDWQTAGVWHRLHLLLLDELRGGAGAFAGWCARTTSLTPVQRNQDVPRAKTKPCDISPAHQAPGCVGHCLS